MMIQELFLEVGEIQFLRFHSMTWLQYMAVTGRPSYLNQYRHDVDCLTILSFYQHLGGHTGVGKINTTILSYRNSRN